MKRCARVCCAWWVAARSARLLRCWRVLMSLAMICPTATARWGRTWHESKKPWHGARRSWVMWRSRVQQSYDRSAYDSGQRSYTHLYNLLKSDKIMETTMGKDLGLLCLTVVLPLGFNSVALAQSSDGAPYELSGTSISGTSNPAQRIMTAPVGPGGALKFENGLHLYPSVSTNIGYNDNLLSDNSNSLKSSYTDLASTVVGELKHKGDRYTALASIYARRYSESAADNINDSQFVVAADNYYSARAR